MVSALAAPANNAAAATIAVKIRIKLSKDHTNVTRLALAPIIGGFNGLRDKTTKRLRSFNVGNKTFALHGAARCFCSPQPIGPPYERMMQHGDSMSRET
jgi:hypothetical protein